jgi:hypothetical protein
MVTRDTVCVAQAQDSPGRERQQQAHDTWPERRTAALWFGVFAGYAGLVAVFTGHADRDWGVWGFGAYAIAALLLRFGKTWVIPLVGTIGVGLVAPMLWLATQQPATAEVIVITRGAHHLLHYATPYLSPGQLTSWTAYNPYMPVMELFGLPRALGLTGVLSDPRIWTTIFTAAVLALSLAVLRPHRLRDCPRCRGHVAKVTAIALASPVFAFPLALGVTDPPVIAVLCLTLAWAHQGKWARAGLVLAVACAMKSTAWAAIPVLAVLAAVRYTPRAAARFTMTAIGATAVLTIAAAPQAIVHLSPLVQNTVYFPLGLTAHKTPAESPLPGHLLATLGAGGQLAAMALMATAALAFAAWLLVRPPRSAQAAGWRLAIGFAVIFTLDPSSRFGYYAYPLGILGWLVLTSLLPERPVSFVSRDRSPALVR